MKNLIIFVDRRSGRDRRQDFDPCKDMSIDMFHRKRRKSADRRQKERNLEQDYYAFMRRMEKLCESYYVIQ